MTDDRSTAAELQRRLGLYTVIAISVGGMIGGGIFVLPGEAAKLAGPSALLAYLLAGFAVLPAALSKAELATAMPESGGTYLFIDRAMGPLAGTIAGFGVWFSLVFKAAFALVGLGAYLQLVVAVPGPGVALAAAALLIAVNVAGAKVTGQLQTVTVAVALLALGVFSVWGFSAVERAAFVPFFDGGGSGLLAATGLVFISYSGVTKIASVAEEVREPGRTIPRAIIASVVLMMVVYTATVAVVVGTVPLNRLTDTLTPVGLASEFVFGPAGVVAVAVVATLALLGMANAGLLSASRYPFAMGRDSLLPALFERVHPRLGTPVAAIALTGGLLLGLIAFVPVIDLAKLASAFQILVFVLINVAVVAFREAHVGWYTPEFRAPVYPWLQVAGVVSGVVLLTQMGPLSVLGAIGIIAAGVVLYRAYGRSRTVREGAALDVLRRRSASRVLDVTEQALEGRRERAMVLLPDELAADAGLLRRYLRVVAGLIERPASRIDVLRLPVRGVERDSALNAATLADGLHVAPERVRCDTVGAATPRRDAVVQTVGRHSAELLIVPLQRHVGDEIDALVADVHDTISDIACDTVFVRPGNTAVEVHTVAVFSASGPYDAFKVSLANRLAVWFDGGIRFVHLADPSASDAYVRSMEAYHARLGHMTAVETRSRIERDADLGQRLVELQADAEIVVTGDSLGPHEQFPAMVQRLADVTGGPLIVVHPQSAHQRSPVRRAVGGVLFGPGVDLT